MLAIPFGLSLSSGSLVVLLVAAPLFLGVSLWAIGRYTHRFMIGSVLILTLIPIVGFPSQEYLQPGVLGLIVLAFASFVGLLSRRRTQVTMIDVAALVILAGCVLSVAYGHQNKKDLDHVFFLWFCPYFAARSITGSGHRTTVLKALALAGAVAIPLGIVEITYGNLLLKAFPFGVQGGLGVPNQRFGINRVEGAFGQPIPYAMFLSIAAVAAITLWLIRNDRRSYRWLYIGLGILAIQAAALSRTGWLVLGVVAGLVIVLRFKAIFKYNNRHLIALAVVGLVVIFTVPKTNALILGSSGTESMKLETSASYRSELIHQALQPGYIDPFGTTVPQIGPHGKTSIDDEYIHAAWTWGYLPLMGFALMFVAFILGAWQHRRDTVALAVYATCVATMVALVDVAFLSQQEVLIWLLWGYASGMTVQPARNKLALEASTMGSYRQRPQIATASEHIQPGSYPPTPVMFRHLRQAK